MKILNPFKLQNWEYKKFLIVILGIQLSLLGLFGFNKLGFETPILRALIGFVYVSFVPGYLILRILKLNKLDSLESFLYSVGLSIFFVMLVGFLINIIYPNFGITNKPLSEMSIIISLLITTLFLTILNKNSMLSTNNQEHLNLKDIVTPKVLFLSLIPFLAIFGTYLVNYYQNNFLIILLILIIAILPIFAVIYNIIPKQLYPYTLWIMAISLIFHVSLIGQYTPIYDGENLPYEVIENSFWEMDKDIGTFNGVYNSVLSTNVLATFFVKFLDISLTNTYKILYPILLSFTALGVFKISRLYTDPKKSFLATFLLIGTAMFYINIPMIRKQVVAELFLVLLILLFLNKKYHNSNILKLIFIVALPWSHYGISVLFLGLLAFTALTLVIFKKIDSKIGLYSDKFSIFTIFLIFITISWYLFISNSSTFISITNTAFKVFITVLSVPDPEQSRGTQILNKEMPSILWSSLKLMYMATIATSSLGIINYTYNFVKSKFIDGNLTTICFSSYWLMILGASVIVPHFSVMSPYRLFHVFTLFSGFLCILGLEVMFKILQKTLKMPKKIDYEKSSLKLITVFLVFFMLFNTQIIFEFAKDHPKSISFSQISVTKYGTIDDIYFVYRRLINHQDRLMNMWVKNNQVNGKITHLNDDSGAKLEINNQTYLVVNKFTTTFNKYVRKTSWELREYKDINTINNVLEEHNKIYNNGEGYITHP
ncbi:DUF2206 domain-containing protein [Methanococcus maripaludis]|nr:DUF2206 domain-containing protein [Methanococcus maripaludis]